MPYIMLEYYNNPWSIPRLRLAERPVLEQHGFPSDKKHQMVLLDDPSWDAMRRPTLQNMRKALGLGGEQERVPTGSLNIVFF